MLKRIFLFLLTNILVLIVISVTLTVLTKVLWINIWWYFNWSNYLSVLIYAWVVWFAWAFISLALSKTMAKWSYGMVFITENTLNEFSPKERLVYNVVADLSRREWIKTPEVGIYDSQEPNAFATWATKNSSLVAVSTWLLQSMNEDEITWVVAHEVAHITNWDMVTMTLLQWIINTFVIFLSRIIASIAEKFFSNSDEESSSPSWIYFVVSFVLEIIFSILASIVVMWFSRVREFRADEGSSKYVWKEKMISALKKLKSLQELMLTDDSDKLATMKIGSRKRGWIFALFSSHPDLDDRIANLEGKSF